MYGYYIAEITIPEGTKVVLEGNKYRSEGIIINSLTPMKEFKFNESIDWINNLEKQNPSIYELFYITCFSLNKEYKEKASELLLKINSSNYVLLTIIQDSTEKYKQKAWNLFKNNNPREKDLEYIIHSCSESYIQKAKDLLNGKI